MANSILGVSLRIPLVEQLTIPNPLPEVPATSSDLLGQQNQVADDLDDEEKDKQEYKGKEIENQNTENPKTPELLEIERDVQRDELLKEQNNSENEENNQEQLDDVNPESRERVRELLN